MGPLLAALRLLAADDPEQAKQLEVVFAGSLTDEERRALAAPDLAGTVRFVGWLERPRALALQRAADALLVVTGGAERRSVATGKLFEYLASGRPILVLGDETEAARIVGETGSGLSAPASDPRRSQSALRRVLEAAVRQAERRRRRRVRVPGPRRRARRDDRYRRLTAHRSG